MANRIKGITVEIGGDTTRLQNALKGVNSQIKSTESQLRDVNKLLKLDPGNTELISQKYKLLNQAVEETKQKLETLKTAAANADKALAEGTISQEQYDALQREIIETEQDLKKLEQAANESANAMEGIVQKGEKLNAAFNANEGNVISKTHVDFVYDVDKKGEEKSYGNATTDKIYLLSSLESETYFPEEDSLKCKPTAYAEAKGASVYKGSTLWWFRSCSYVDNNAACSDGFTGRWDGKWTTVEIRVRPVMWIDFGY